MLARILDKQRLAVGVIKTALLRCGICGRSVCVSVDSWEDQYGQRENYAVFVQSGGNDEPFYVTGKTITEAVKNMIDSIKGRMNDAGQTDQAKPAPF